MSLARSIAFHISVLAGPSEVDALVDDIYRFFNIEGSTAGVAPGDLAPAATLNHEAAAASDTADTVYDANNRPWDERIHSGSKALNADGSWRYRKGVTPPVKSKVEAELDALRGATATPAAAVAAPPPVAAAAAPSLPAPPVIAAPAPVPVVDPTYTNFVAFVSGQLHDPVNNPTGRITDEWVKAVLVNYGVPEGSMQNLAHRVDLVPAIETAIRTALGL